MAESETLTEVVLDFGPDFPNVDWLRSSPVREAHTLELPARLLGAGDFAMWSAYLDCSRVRLTHGQRDLSIAGGPLFGGRVDALEIQFFVDSPADPAYHADVLAALGRPPREFSIFAEWPPGPAIPAELVAGVESLSLNFVGPLDSFEWSRLERLSYSGYDSASTAELFDRAAWAAGLRHLVLYSLGTIRPDELVRVARPARS